MVVRALSVPQPEAPKGDALALPSEPKACAYVSDPQLMAMLYHVAPYGPAVPHYGELASAMSRAANELPLFPSKAYGAEFTACLLLSLAFFASELNATKVTPDGKRFGLYQISPVVPEWNSHRLTLPSDACRFVAGMLRLSFENTKGRSWEERLSWYLGAIHGIGSENHPTVVFASVERMIQATALFERFFPARRGNLPPKDEHP